MTTANMDKWNEMRAKYSTPFWNKMREFARADMMRGTIGNLIGSSVKVEKGEALNVLTGIVYGAPAFAASLKKTTCAGASISCVNACLGITSGHGQLHMIDGETGRHNVQIARIRRSVLFMEHRAQFFAILLCEIAALRRKANKLGMLPAVRLNGTTDFLFEREKVSIDAAMARKLARYGVQVEPGLYAHVFAVFPDVAFYDYSKILSRDVSNIPNYHLTYSFDGEDVSKVHLAMSKGWNVAVAFRARPAQYRADGTLRRAPDALPKTWQGYPVFDADDTDVRFMDPKGVICGLHVKGSENLRSDAPFIVDFPEMKYRREGDTYIRIR